MTFCYPRFQDVFKLKCVLWRNDKYLFQFIDGLVVLNDDYVRNNRKIYAQLICHFRYGREEDETMGLNFQKELTLASQQIYPQEKSDVVMTKMQERLLKKLGPNAFPFLLTMPPNSPASITLQQKAGDESQPCGIQYFVKVTIKPYNVSYK